MLILPHPPICLTVRVQDLYIGSLNDHRGLPGVNDDRFLGLVIAELVSDVAPIEVYAELVE